MWQGSVFMLCAKDEAIWPDATPWHEREKGHGVAVGGGGGFGVWTLEAPAGIQCR